MVVQVAGRPQIQQQRYQSEDAIDRGMGRVLAALQIANTGFGIINKFDERDAREIQMARDQAQTNLFEAKTQEVQASMTPEAKLQKGIVLLQERVDKSEPFKQGQAKVLESEGIIKLSQLAKEGDVNAQNLMQTMIAKAALGGALSDDEFGRFSGDPSFMAYVKRFYDKNIKGKPYVADTQSLLNISRTQYEAGQNQIRLGIQDSASQIAQRTGLKVEDLIGGYPTDLLKPIQFPNYTRPQSKSQSQPGNPNSELSRTILPSKEDMASGAAEVVGTVKKQAAEAGGMISEGYQTVKDAVTNFFTPEENPKALKDRRQKIQKLRNMVDQELKNRNSGGGGGK